MLGFPQMCFRLVRNCPLWLVNAGEDGVAAYLSQVYDAVDDGLVPLRVCYGSKVLLPLVDR